VTEARFDEVVHAPHRLRILALLAAVAGQVEFAILRDLLDVADSVLSKHLKVLHDCGYVELRKPTGQGRVRTWVQLTTRGRDAYAAHVAALREIVERGPGEAVGDSPR
jgi:DNA-binding transcriptional ArsR family regulator